MPETKNQDNHPNLDALTTGLPEGGIPAQPGFEKDHQFNEQVRTAHIKALVARAKRAGNFVREREKITQLTHEHVASQIRDLTELQFETFRLTGPVLGAAERAYFEK